jgi:hypothetical protein
MIVASIASIDGKPALAATMPTNGERQAIKNPATMHW